MRTATSTLTSKGQLTVPIEIRRWLGLKQGDEVEFAEEDGRVYLRPKRKVVDYSKFIGAGLKDGITKESWDEYWKEIRGEYDEAE